MELIISPQWLELYWSEIEHAVTERVTPRQRECSTNTKIAMTEGIAFTPSTPARPGNCGNNTPSTPPTRACNYSNNIYLSKAYSNNIPLA